MGETERWRQMLLDIVVAMVDEPERVSVTQSLEAVGTREELVLYTITLAPPDTGRVIGRQGRRIAALNSILAGWAGRAGLRARVDIAGRFEKPALAGAAAGEE